MIASDCTAISGSCHCGNIRFTLQWPGPGSEIPVRKCGCTFCRKHGGSWTSHPGSNLVAEISDQSSVSKYAFGTQTAEFFVCSGCGVIPFVTSKIDGNRYAVVNVNAFEEVGDFSFSSSATDFDAEDLTSRLERRKRNWIPDVLIKTSVT